MGFMKMLWGLVEMVLFALVIVLALEFYKPELIPLTIPHQAYTAALIGVVGISVLITLMHMGWGMVFGLAGGDFLDGVKLGGILGACYGIGRLWPYFLAWGVGSFFGEAPLWHTVVAVIMAFVVFSFKMIIKYFWGNMENQSTIG